MTKALEKNRTIARNTFLLYFRMILLMVINLYASRVILDVLGISDYGIYNVVGGVIAMFSFLSNSFSTSVSRYITVALGEGDKVKLNTVFSTSVNVQVLMSIIIVVLAEIIGLWFLRAKINLPDGRLGAAQWVFQCSLLAFLVNLISVPYNATIIAHERMNAFAYISILEAVLKLLIVFLLYKLPFDKLKTYAILTLVVSMVIRFVYRHYAKNNFEESKYHYVYDKDLTKKMFSFAGWNVVGNGAWILNTQGVNILINIFFGVTLNASRGIATQVDGVVQQFVSNFNTAFSPQLTKSYASGDMAYYHKLIIAGSKFTAFLLFFLIVPICLEAETILSLWLVEVPEYAATFVRFTLIGSCLVSIENPLFVANNATGKIKKYQMTISLLLLLIFSFTFVAFKLGFPVVTTYIIYVIVYLILCFVKPLVAQNNIGMPAVMYFKEVLLRVFIVGVLVFLTPWLITKAQEPGVLRSLETIISSVVSTAFFVYFIGLKREERKMLRSFVVKTFKKSQ